MDSRDYVNAPRKIPGGVCPLPKSGPRGRFQCGALRCKFSELTCADRTIPPLSFAILARTRYHSQYQPTESETVTITTPAGDVITVDDIALNVLTLYAESDRKERETGMDWYASAYRDCATIADRWGLDVRTVVAVVAVTSPLMQWSRNLFVAEGLIALFTLGLPSSRGQTLNNSGRRAYRALSGDLDDVERSPKVANFYHSIMGDRGAVCIDRHAYTAATGFPGATVSIGVAPYRIIAAGYREAARDLRLGVRHLQAIVWCAVQGGKGLTA